MSSWQTINTTVTGILSSATWENLQPAAWARIASRQSIHNTGKKFPPLKLKRGAFVLLPGNQGQQLRAVLSCSHRHTSAGGGCCLLDLTHCFASRVREQLVGKHRQMFALWVTDRIKCEGVVLTGLMLSQFLGACGCLENCNAANVSSPGASCHLTDNFWALQFGICHLKKELVWDFCHWFPARLNPFRRPLTLGFCWHSILVRSNSFTKSFCAAL